jgi:hypothetical protein
LWAIALIGVAAKRWNGVIGIASAAGKAVQIATLVGHPTLAAGDFIVV